MVNLDKLKKTLRIGTCSQGTNSTNTGREISKPQVSTLSQRNNACPQPILKKCVTKKTATTKNKEDDYYETTNKINVFGNSLMTLAPSGTYYIKGPNNKYASVNQNNELIFDTMKPGKKNKFFIKSMFNGTQTTCNNTTLYFHRIYHYGNDDHTNTLGWCYHTDDHAIKCDSMHNTILGSPEQPFGIRIDCHGFFSLKLCSPVEKAVLNPLKFASS